MKDVAGVMNKLNKANNLMEDLIDMAMEDEKLSDDEKDMLFSINRNLGGYARLIVDTISDGKITDEERRSLRALEENIIEEAQSIAAQDDRISDEEKKLLNELITTVKSMN